MTRGKVVHRYGPGVNAIERDAGLGGLAASIVSMIAAFADVVASATPLRRAAFVRPAAIVGLVGAIAWLNLGGVRRGAQLVGVATAPLYIAGCLAAWRLARSNVALAGRALNFCWLGIAAAAGIASMLAIIALGSRMEILGLLVLVGISGAVYVLQSRLAPANTVR